MLDLVLQYRNTEDIRRDASISYQKNMEKARQAFENGELNPFTYLLFAIVYSIVALAISVYYQIKFSIKKATLPDVSQYRFTEDQYERMSILETLEGYNKPVSDSVTNIKKDKTLQQLSLTYLRKQLVANGNILKGSIIRTSFPKITGEELLNYTTTGDFKKPFIVQRVTFGNDINKALKVIFPEVKNRKVRGQSDTYIVFEGDEVFTLEQKLREVFMCPVTINLRGNDEK